MNAQIQRSANCSDIATQRMALAALGLAQRRSIPRLRTHPVANLELIRDHVAQAGTGGAVSGSEEALAAAAGELQERVAVMRRDIPPEPLTRRISARFS
jgi:hypothetical protein